MQNSPEQLTNGRRISADIAGNRVAMVLPNLSAGGAQRSVLELGCGLLDRGVAVDLVLTERGGAYSSEIPDRMRVVVLPEASRLRARAAVLRSDPAGIRVLLSPVLLSPKPSRRIRFVEGLADYLAAVRPTAMLSAMTYTNLQALWARRLAGVDTRIVVSERTSLSESLQTGGRKRASRWRCVPELVRRYYPWADAITAVSFGAAADLATIAGLPLAAITPIYNPVVSERLLRLAQAPVDHAWFAAGHDVILAAGRLEPVKDFATLLRAFARVRQMRDAKLIILGAGSQREPLLRLAQDLGIASDLALPGWVENPFAYMAKARVFVLSSRYEGLPGVLIQALACGCPCIATDCPSGPSEILGGGRYGTLVPVGDSEALATSIQRSFMAAPDRDGFRRRGLDFSVAQAVDRYLSLLLPGLDAAKPRDAIPGPGPQRAVIGQ